MQQNAVQSAAKRNAKHGKTQGKMQQNAGLNAAKRRAKCRKLQAKGKK